MKYATSLRRGRGERALPWALAALIVLFTAVGNGFRAQSIPVRDPPQSNFWHAYAEANLRLAEAELAEAESQNRRVAGSISEYDLRRLRLQRDFAEQSRSMLSQGGDFGELAALSAKLHAELADLDVAMAEAARREYPSTVSDERIDCLRCNAEVCRLEVMLAAYSESELSAVDQLQWDTHRLRANVMRMSLRLERLEELVQGR